MRCLEKDPAARPQSARRTGAGAGRIAAGGTMDPEHRAAWWAEHRKSIAGLPKPALPSDSSQIDQTVKIEFAERTP